MRQKHTVLGFLLVADSAPSSGEDRCSQGKLWPNGNAAGRRLYGRWFEPRLDKHGGGAADNSQPTRIQTADLKPCNRLRYDSTGVWCDSNMPPHGLGPSERKLLTPHPHPPTPPLKKLISSFRG